MDENRNFLLAMVLCFAIFIVWQYVFIEPAQQQQRQLQAQRQAEQAQQVNPAGTPIPGVNAPAPALDRQTVIGATERVAIDTPSIVGSISLNGGRIDDIALKKYRVEVKSDSRNVVLFSPPGAAGAFYAEYGWVDEKGAVVAGDGVIWRAESRGALSPGNPVTLVYDNGKGLIFRKIIAVDDDYLFTIRQEVENQTQAPVTLSPYALVRRHDKPQIEGFFIQHEGLIGVSGGEGKQEYTYDKLTGDDDYEAGTKKENRIQVSQALGGWIGITDKYWAATVIPDQAATYNARYGVAKVQGRDVFQTDYLLQPVVVAPGAKQAVTGRLFAGAKQVSVVDGYEETFGIKRFELLIDWGWFHIITKPLFYVLDFFYKLVGNFGVSILIVTVLIKLAFFPLNNKSYASMSKMKKLQPEMMRIRDRFKDDKVRQQQELMALYKKEKLNPLAGCLPILFQIPVFFALYKVLFITIEMRHAPFFGWIQDLSAPDPTTIFNLFGLLPYDPGAVPIIGSFLMLGIWPILMGITMWVQMKLNPTPTDPVQQAVFTWMPVLFTFMLAAFPAGLVIYWTWNNLLSILQQWVIMRRQGVKVELWDNMGFGGKKLAAATPAPTPAPAPAAPPARAASATRPPTRSNGRQSSKSRNRGKRS
jgi:YidC/Oxa1 family membrane protein insertase